MTPKNPFPRSQLLPPDSSHLTEYTGRLWRIHTTSGVHPAAWDDLRNFGPLASARWDPHPGNPATATLHPPRIAVSYAATTLTATFAEIFQGPPREIRLRADRSLTGWTPVRPLRLLDLTSHHWLVANSASASLAGAAKHVCRAWSRAILEEFGQGPEAPLDGLLVRSTMVHDEIVILFPAARTAFPSAPAFSRPLDHPVVLPLALKARGEIGGNWPLL